MTSSNSWHLAMCYLSDENAEPMPSQILNENEISPKGLLPPHIAQHWNGPILISCHSGFFFPSCYLHTTFNAKSSRHAKFDQNHLAYSSNKKSPNAFFVWCLIATNRCTSLINDLYGPLFQVSLGMEKSGEDLDMDFPLDVATVPYRIPNNPPPDLRYGRLGRSTLKRNWGNRAKTHWLTKVVYKL